MGKHSINQNTRTRVIQRDGLRCRYCGTPVGAVLTEIDHIIPRSRGGWSIEQNLVVVCRPCNQFKRDRTPEEAGMTLLPEPQAEREQ